ncbi:MAG TPA: bifunctional glutamate N-acetyltransferase/amino-acid acetyltransferase ArgJ [Miltoncostaeaceae bacterium]|nr:bifunctional glutamate N-acetyltransferase/amino-acid acetyltransferase ArgJ [Miltoncostaeaceae bacterium]
MSRIDGGITAPTGFRAAGIACGVKPSGVRDIALLVSDRPTTSGLVDTTSALPSAPVQRNRTIDRAAIRAVLVNSGKANAATGSVGLEDAHTMGERAARLLDIPARQVAVCSTGTIGERVELNLVGPGIDTAVRALSPGGAAHFGQAICTTDRAPKGGAFRLSLEGGPVTIGAAAKGAGMISPNMATMLAYLTTDASVSGADLQAITAEAAAAAFNRISIDGQMSPSDTLVVIANGDGPPLEGADRERFAAAVAAICRWLAIQMVKDGEGAEHAVRLQVTGAADASKAQRVARAIGNSPLVKTAIFGRDPNWGRISQAVGQALAGAGDAREPRVWLDGAPLDDPAAAAVMDRAEYDLRVDLSRGAEPAELWISDLTHAYVTLNAEYHT